MYVTIRQYRGSNIPEAGRRTQEGFVPVVKEVSGVSAWYLADGGDGTLFTVTLSDDQGSAEKLAGRAREWVQGNLADIVEGAPTVTSGEVLSQA